MLVKEYEILSKITCKSLFNKVKFPVTKSNNNSNPPANISFIIVHILVNINPTLDQSIEPKAVILVIIAVNTCFVIVKSVVNPVLISANILFTKFLNQSHFVYSKTSATTKAVIPIKIISIGFKDMAISKAFCATVAILVAVATASFAVLSAIAFAICAVVTAMSLALVAVYKANFLVLVAITLPTDFIAFKNGLILDVPSFTPVAKSLIPFPAFLNIFIFVLTTLAILLNANKPPFKATKPAPSPTIQVFWVLVKCCKAVDKSDKALAPAEITGDIVSPNSIMAFFPWFKALLSLNPVVSSIFFTASSVNPAELPIWFKKSLN